jgi:choline-sulfatase
MGLVAGVLGMVAPTTTASAQERPNILLIMTDQQSSEAMSCRMGREYIRTPAMDSLAENGMVFTRAYAVNPLCMPARNGLFTGRYPHETGVTMNSVSTSRMTSPEFVAMGNLFRAAGYQTAYFGKWHLCWNAKDKASHGFETIRISPKQGHDAVATKAAVEFLADKHDKPFLLVVSLMNPHNICEYARRQPLPDGPVGKAPPPEQCPPVPLNLAPQENEPDTITVIRKAYHANPMFPVGQFSANDWRQLRWGYYRLVEKVDAEVGTMLGALRKGGLEDNTVIVFTSDHGECAGAHGFNQKTVFYEEAVRVPLIISHKGRVAKGSCDRLVNAGVDILPTLLEFAGIDAPDTLKGRSLQPLAQGKAMENWRSFVVAENHMDQTVAVGGLRPSAQGRMVRSKRYKYCIYTHGNRRESLVDMEKDPDEMVNLAGSAAHQSLLLQHRELLAQFAREHNDSLAAALLADPLKPVAWEADDGNTGKKRK